MRKQILAALCAVAMSAMMAMSFTAFADEAAGPGVSGAENEGFTYTVGKTYDNGRYTVVAGPPRVVPASGQLEGVYTVTRQRIKELEAVAVDHVKTIEHRDFLTQEVLDSEAVYELNGDKLLIGHAQDFWYEDPAGEWVVDNTKPYAECGKTNIRFRYFDGTFAGYGSHILDVDESYTREIQYLIGSIDENGNKRTTSDPLLHKLDPTFAKWGSGSEGSYFSEDGYLYRNCYLKGVAVWDLMLGYTGAKLDRMTF